MKGRNKIDSGKKPVASHLAPSSSSALPSLSSSLSLLLRKLAGNDPPASDPSDGSNLLLLSSRLVRHQTRERQTNKQREEWSQIARKLLRGGREGETFDATFDSHSNHYPDSYSLSLSPPPPFALSPLPPSSPSFVALLDWHDVGHSLSETTRSFFRRRSSTVEILQWHGNQRA